jgi:hypothetical protein
MNINAIKLTQVLDHLWKNHQLLKKEVADKIGLDNQKISNALRSTNLKTPIIVINKIKARIQIMRKNIDKKR